ncbi:MAG TPA: T9SS type A sorting domain-containing protein [Candidatus Kapabacteria bacterium]|nr:T9SS type A sorting domain-containing protein [Candidatus Kapabacteria bacterium]
MRKLSFLCLAFLACITSAHAQSGSWQKVMVSDSLFYFQGPVRFADSLTGYTLACTSVRFAPNLILLRTTNGGLNWEKLPLKGFTQAIDVNFSSTIEVTSPSSVFIMGLYPYSLLSTTDSGSTWRILDSLDGSDYHFWSATGGVHLVSTFEVDETTDGGVTWQQVPNDGGFENLTNDLYFLSTSSGFERGFIVKDSLHWLFPTINDSELYVIRTLDGGVSWELDSTKLLGGFSSPSWNASLIWLYSSGDTTAYSSDFGVAWKSLAGPAPVTPVTNSTMFAARTIGPQLARLDTLSIWESHDTGGNWARTNFYGVQLADLSFLDERHGWIIADSNFSTSAVTLFRTYVYIYHPGTAGVEHGPKPYLTHLFIYPDPATLQVTITGLQSSEDPIELFDIMGRKVSMPSLQVTGTSATIGLHGIPCGCYILRVSHGLQVASIPFVKYGSD